MKRSCILTGASGELGRAFCKIAANKYNILAVCHERSLLHSSQNIQSVDPFNPELPVEENADPLFIMYADLTREEDRARVVEVALARLGEVDVLINAAGFSVWASLLDTTYALDTMIQQFNINAFVPLQLTILLAHRVWNNNFAKNRQCNRGVINVSSIAAAHAVPRKGQSVYAASKAALNIFTIHLASELSDRGIRVNALLPDTFGTKVSLEEVIEALSDIDASDETGKLYEIQSKRSGTESTRR